jgi:hypothetical protein
VQQERRMAWDRCQCHKRGSSRVPWDRCHRSLRGRMPGDETRQQRSGAAGERMDAMGQVP